MVWRLFAGLSPFLPFSATGHRKGNVISGSIQQSFCWSGPSCDKICGKLTLVTKPKLFKTADAADAGLLIDICQRHTACSGSKHRGFRVVGSLACNLSPGTKVFFWVVWVQCLQALSCLSWVAPQGNYWHNFTIFLLFWCGLHFVWGICLI